MSKMAEIFGQLLKNYYGPLEKLIKAELLREAFDGPLRGLQLLLEEMADSGEYAVFAAFLGDLHAGVRFPPYPDDLFFGKALFMLFPRRQTLHHRRTNSGEHVSLRSHHAGGLAVSWPCMSTFRSSCLPGCAVEIYCG
jgi:hypothetical protein